MRRKNRKKRIRIGCLALALAVGLLASGCRNMAQTESTERSAKDTKEKEETIELDYYIWDQEAAYTQRVVEAFNTVQPNIHVNVHELKNETYDSDIKEAMQSGKKIDIMGIRGTLKLADYQQEGMLTELSDDMLKSDLDLTAYGNMVYTYTIDDRYYALPTRSTYWGLYYNKTLFDQAGLPYPEQLTWEEYAQLAKQLTNDETGEKKIWGGYFVDWAYYFAGVQRQNYLYDDDISETMESLLWLNRFYNEDQSHVPLRDVLEISDDYMRVFESGKIAMMPQGEWAAGWLHEDELAGISDIDWDIAPMPVFDHMKKSTTWGQYQFAGIASDCPYPEEAFEFLSYLCGPEGAKIYAAAGMISAYMDDEAMEIYKRSLRGKNVDALFKSQRVQEFPASAEYNDLVDMLKEVAESYLLGESSYEEAVQRMEQKRSEIYNHKAEEE